MDPTARFDDVEVRRILDRAAHRQELSERARRDPPEAGGPGRGEGLSLEDLTAAAEEVGIDAAHVVAAAREVALDTPAPTRPVIGIPRRIEHVRVIPGPLPERGWAAVVGRCREAFGRDGVVSAFGEVREWASGTGAEGPPVRLRIEPDPEGSLVTLVQDTGAVASGIWVGSLSLLATALVLLVLVAVGDFALATAVAVPGATGALGIAGFLGGRVLARSWAERQDARFRALLDGIEVEAARAARSTPSPLVSDSSPPRFP